MASEQGPDDHPQTPPPPFLPSTLSPQAGSSLAGAPCRPQLHLYAPVCSVGLHRCSGLNFGLLVQPLAVFRRLMTGWGFTILFWFILTIPHHMPGLPKMTACVDSLPTLILLHWPGRFQVYLELSMACRLWDAPYLCGLRHRHLGRKLRFFHCWPLLQFPLSLTAFGPSL